MKNFAKKKNLGKIYCFGGITKPVIMAKFGLKCDLTRLFLRLFDYNQTRFKLNFPKFIFSLSYADAFLNKINLHVRKGQMIAN